MESSATRFCFVRRQEIFSAGFLASNREQRRDGFSCEKMKSCPSGGGYGGHGKN